MKGVFSIRYYLLWDLWNCDHSENSTSQDLLVLIQNIQEQLYYHTCLIRNPANQLNYHGNITIFWRWFIDTYKQPLFFSEIDFERYYLKLKWLPWDSNICYVCFEQGVSWHSATTVCRFTLKRESGMIKIYRHYYLNLIM